MVLFAVSMSIFAATTVENYRKLKEAGIGTYILFQETYHRESYEQLHPTGQNTIMLIIQKLWIELWKVALMMLVVAYYSA